MEQEYLKRPMWDTSLSEEERLNDLLSALSLEEKFSCLGTGCPEIERLGIHEFFIGGEGAHGVQARHDQSFDLGEPDYTTVFPNPIGMSASFDRELVKKAGRVTGTEARALFERSGKGGLCLWAPTIDMERDPRWGRTEEAYGEDPFLTGEMAGAYVKGIQGDDPDCLLAGTTVKHFYANNVEEGRGWKSSDMEERDKEEYYLEPYRRVIGQYGAVGMMTAYNSINGLPGILNPEIKTRAKDEWGLVHAVCDGGAMLQTVEEHHYFDDHADTVAAGLKAGIDCFAEDIKEVACAAKRAFEEGKITEEDIDRALRCHFRVMFRLGLFTPEKDRKYKEIGMDAVSCAEHLDTARQMASEAAVLLKNEPAGEKGKLLPLRADSFHKDRKLAIIGPLADVWYKDWYSGLPPYYVTPLAGIKKYISEEALLVEKGLDIVKVRSDNGTYLGISGEDGAVTAVCAEKAEEFELEWWSEKVFTLRALSNGKLVRLEDEPGKETMKRGRLYTCSEECFGWFAKEAFTWEGDQDALKGTITGWNGKSIAVDEEGFFQMQEEGQKISSFQFEIRRSGIEAAKKAAEEAEVSLVFTGANPIITCREEHDRDTLQISPYHTKLAKAVWEKNASAAMVLITSVPFSLCWEEEHLPAILMTASGGMELGHALADLIFGTTAPAGRLPMTWYRSEKDLPDMDDYSIIEKGRTYRYFEGQVLYPFGHGLTYADVLYDHMQTQVSGGKVDLTFDLSNQGNTVTDEVVQVYVRKRESEVKLPLKQLTAFDRIKKLQPGEKREVMLSFPMDDLAYYDVSKKRKVFLGGEYEIMAGASCEDIRIRTRVYLSKEDSFTH